MSKGTVYLVGAGPGGPEYLTRRGGELLGHADVVFHDDLVDERLLALAPTAEVIDVGKRAGAAGTQQEEICRLMIERAQAGQTVVRLKSGDPAVFGRLVPELEALSAAEIPFELVPGVSSALAAPLLAGIPLTDRHWSQHFCVLSAHALDTLPWQKLVGIDTLVLLMGTRQAGEIARRLMDCGRPAIMPVAAIYWAGRPEQRVVVSSLETLADDLAPGPDPAVLVVGPVVRHRERFAWFEKRPLAGRQILVTRSVEQAGEFSERLRQLGAGVIEMPALTVTPPSSWEPLDRAIDALSSYRWLVLTSANGVEAFFARLRHHRRDLRALAGVRVAVVGPKTAQTAERFGLLPDFVPGEYVADSLLAEFPDREALAGARVLFVRVESGGREVIPERLSAWGAQVDEVPGYATGCPDCADPAALAALASGTVDAITFASSKTVHHFSRLVGDEKLREWTDRVLVASIGPQTSRACRAVFGRVDIEASLYTLSGLGDALIAHWMSGSTARE